MRQKELLSNIQKYLARFVAQVKISTLNNEYDINIHAENVLIPILNEILNLNFVNANINEKNAEAIDLIDESNKVAVQVTSTHKIEKIKKTLTKFLHSKYKGQINKLYLYILTEKQSRYSQKTIDTHTQGLTAFDVHSQILDASSIYQIIKERNDLELIERIEGLLQNQFTDVYITKDFTISNLNEFKTSYYKSCETNFSRINFFGLSVKTRPREIELYDLFVAPSFRVQNYGTKSELPVEDLVVQEDLVEDLTILPKLNDDYSHLVPREMLSKILLEYNDKVNDKLLYDSLIEVHFKDYFKGVNKVKETDFSQLFSGPKHFVVLGKPGAGKSSFIKYTICKLLQKDTKIFEHKEIYQFVPLRVELHKYNTFKKQNKSGILKYISVMLDEDFGQNLNDLAIKHLLNTFQF